jgi:hypothetical protein
MMIDWFGKLPGFQRTPYGRELKVLRWLPAIWAGGTLLALLMVSCAHLWLNAESAAELSRRVQLIDFIVIGMVIIFWTLVFTVAIGCVIVWIMKGPAYVADGLEVSHRDSPGGSAHGQAGDKVTQYSSK